MSMDYSKVEGHSNLIRDCSTNAILNTDISEYNNYIQMKNIKKGENERISIIENEIHLLKNELTQLKLLINRFVKNESKQNWIGKCK